MMRSPGEAAARHYIAEREAKRVLIQDIPRHTSCRAGQGGYAQYAGWRQIDGHALILLKTNEAEISVMPVDAVTLARVKRLKLGSEVIFNADGTVRKKGRSL
ncbi:hypothetical protein EBAPG3_014180 [Nitrosospira lacus]|uniref:TraI-like C-terminal domain-containing protein n=1 Tax=Nitrosospira lacus TaxID=1288494 RepID=A0A1W6SSN7_9PROT|nr:hypothetical protein [Nitrosospira lacus]ARO88824.1 hypothetical protein EBAPG3_014180 [Nitrosospira lacus]